MISFFTVGVRGVRKEVILVIWSTLVMRLEWKGERWREVMW